MNVDEWLQIAWNLFLVYGLWSCTFSNRANLMSRDSRWIGGIFFTTLLLASLGLLHFNFNLGNWDLEERIGP